MRRTINSNNFFKNTVAQFQYTKTPSTPPDFISKSGSEYWLYDNGVIRKSDHWGDVASCCWEADESIEFALNMDDEPVSGFCSWESFTHINDVEPKYALSINSVI